MTHLGHQSSRIFCRLNLRPVEGDDEQPQRSEGIPIGLLEQPLREGLNFSLQEFRIHRINYSRSLPRPNLYRLYEAEE
jgi:hypothetical protein